MWILVSGDFGRGNETWIGSAEGSMVSRWPRNRTRVCEEQIRTRGSSASLSDPCYDHVLRLHLLTLFPILVAQADFLQTGYFLKSCFALIVFALLSHPI